MTNGIWKAETGVSVSPVLWGSALHWPNVLTLGIKEQKFTVTPG